VCVVFLLLSVSLVYMSPHCQTNCHLLLLHQTIKTILYSIRPVVENWNRSQGYWDFGLCRSPDILKNTKVSETETVFVLG
jgi:hypothetical protein